MKINSKIKSTNTKHILWIGIMTISLSYFPKEIFAQAPNLGTASTFAVFTSSGAFDNIGASNITGDIGTNVGALTGFPPGILDGNIHVADPVAAQVSIDLIAAYDDLVARTCGIVLGISIGSGQTLTPDVYCIGSAATLNGDLILDGQGNPNSLFIFKIDGALSTAAFSNVILINSASMNNVYWQVNGVLNLGESSVFNGSAFTNGAISLFSNSTLFGRALSRAGAISVDNSFVDNGLPPLSTLPIELLSFTAKQIGTTIQLNWSTSIEINQDYFSIERSKDGNYFEEVLREFGIGNSSSVLNYSAIDFVPYIGISYYRLKQTDFDGKFTYSSLVPVNFVNQLAEVLTIYPNPFTNSITLIINEVNNNNQLQLTIYNTLGSIVLCTPVTEQSTKLETNNFHSGIYFYKVTGSETTIQSGILIAK